MRAPTLVQNLFGAVARFRWSWLVAALAFSAAAAFAISTWLAAVTFPAVTPSAQSSEVLAHDGQIIASLHGEQNRREVSLNQVSRNLHLAVLSAEDKDFFDHRGMSVKSIIRAAGANLMGGGIRQGGSTITQQYVRNALPEIGRERRFARKLKEAFWAIQLERYHPKHEILERYLNTVYFGRGAYGVEAAARTYFKVSSSELTLGQAAYLAGIIRAPERYQIDEDTQGALGLRNLVLDGMLDQGKIDEAQSEAARKEKLAEQFRPGASIEVASSRAGYFVEYVRRMLKNQFNLSDEQILRGGLQVHTTLDLNMQDAAEAAVKAVLGRQSDPEAAIVAMGPLGEVRAMVGGRDVDSVTRARGFNFAADVNQRGGGRQAGSAFKPFALAAFLDSGTSLASTFPGTSPLTIESGRCRNKDGTAWEVANFEQAQYQSLDVTGATLSSVNTVYAQIMNTVVSPGRFIKMALAAGIDIPASDSGCALALGTSDVTPLEMARAYTTFAQRGVRPDPLVITKIVSPDGAVIAERFPTTQPAIDRNVADQVNYVLARNVQGGTGNKAKIGRPAAAKTGTTQNYSNAWFAGYTPDLTAVVWIGHAPDAEGKIAEMRDVGGQAVTGSSLPAQIWKRFMTRAHDGLPVRTFNKPVLDGDVLNLVPAGPEATLAQAPATPPAGPSDMVPAAARADQQGATGANDQGSDGGEASASVERAPAAVAPPRQAPDAQPRPNNSATPDPQVTSSCFPFCDP
ncbi:MAG: transglycosylase domain-containing protein [Actinomycetota bacterium]